MISINRFIWLKIIQKSLIMRPTSRKLDVTVYESVLMQFRRVQYKVYEGFRRCYANDLADKSRELCVQ